MCNCIEEQRKKIREGTDVISCYIKLANLRAVKVGKFVGPYKTGQEIEYIYPHKKKNGTIINKTVKTFISHTHCPWCGFKYES